MKTKNSLLTPLIILLFVISSIVATYYSKIVDKDFDIIYSETGLPELDEE